MALQVSLEKKRLNHILLWPSKNSAGLGIDYSHRSGKNPAVLLDSN